MKLHFISGLPRSGSTLLVALLRQNPRFHAAMSSPAAQIMMSVQRATSRGSEGGVFVSEAQRKRMLRGIVANYYAGTKNEVIFDTNRAWCAKMPLVDDLFPESKVICCVRSVPWIMNSIEKLLQANPTELSGIFGFQPNGTVYNRIGGLAAPDGMVGFAINALREAYHGPFADRLLLVEYEALVGAPNETIAQIYHFIGEPPFAHDFENFEYEAREFDTALGTPGLHTVRGPVRIIEQRSVLPPELFDRFANDAFWRDQKANRRGVKTLMWAPRPAARAA